MTKTLCDKCEKEMRRYPNTNVDIRWSFFEQQSATFALCKSCDQTTS